MMLQGPAKLIDDRSDMASADIGTSAITRRCDWRHSHEVSLDQLQGVASRVGNSRVAQSKLLSPRIGRILDFT